MRQIIVKDSTVSNYLGGLDYESLYSAEWDYDGWKTKANSINDQTLYESL